MIIELFGRNFGCFRDDFRLSMLATDIDPGSERGIVNVPVEGEDEPLRLLRCAGIYGPNASGKSTVLRAAGALGYLLRESAEFASDRPIRQYEPFLLDERTRSQPVRLGVRAVVESRVYEYTIEFNETEFLSEKLLELAPKADRTLVERARNEVGGEWTANKQFSLLVPFRANALLLSLADRVAPALAGNLAAALGRLLRSHQAMQGGPWIKWPDEAARRAYEQPEEFQPWLLQWLRSADVGIIGLQVEKVPDEGARERQRSFGYEQKFKLALVHSSAAGPVSLSYRRESLGTRTVLDLAPLFNDLTHGRERVAYFVDEIAASVHPTLLQSLIFQFNCRTPSKKVNGQLIFATHETLVLDAEARVAPLRRDQVYLTEKDADGAARLYSVADFKERQNLNMRRRYLQGRYGALPSPSPMGPDK